MRKPPGEKYGGDLRTASGTRLLAQPSTAFRVIPPVRRTNLQVALRVDSKEVGKELGVRYVVEGSVQRDQNRVRVSAQLIDAASGAHLCAPQRPFFDGRSNRA